MPVHYNILSKNKENEILSSCKTLSDMHIASFPLKLQHIGNGITMIDTEITYLHDMSEWQILFEIL